MNIDKQKKKSIEDPMTRFFKYVDVLDSECWQWVGSLKTGGYANFTIRDGVELAHRFSYKVFVGDIPEDKHLDHLCRNRGCVNPEHLEPVTRKENILRGESPHAKNSRKTECNSGHKYTEKNTYWGKRGRECRTCKRLFTRKKYREEHKPAILRGAYKSKYSKVSYGC